MLLLLCFRVPCHIVHLSSASALPMIRKARADSVPLTIETTHHYLSLTAEDVPEGATQYKCCPPVRDSKNQVSIDATFIRKNNSTFNILLSNLIRLIIPHNHTIYKGYASKWFSACLPSIYRIYSLIRRTRL